MEPTNRRRLRFLYWKLQYWYVIMDEIVPFRLTGNLRGAPDGITEMSIHMQKQKGI